MNLRHDRGALRGSVRVPSPGAPRSPAAHGGVVPLLEGRARRSPWTAGPETMGL